MRFAPAFYIAVRERVGVEVTFTADGIIKYTVSSLYG